MTALANPAAETPLAVVPAVAAVLFSAAVVVAVVAADPSCCVKATDGHTMYSCPHPMGFVFEASLVIEAAVGTSTDTRQAKDELLCVYHSQESSEVHCFLPKV